MQSNSNSPSTSRTISDAPPIYNAPQRPEYCANCGMELATEQDMRRHLEQHETCPADDCDFAALAGILERHIEAHHITGLYKSVKKVWTQEDIAAWRAERRKKLVLLSVYKNIHSVCSLLDFQRLLMLSLPNGQRNSE